MFGNRVLNRRGLPYPFGATEARFNRALVLVDCINPGDEIPDQEPGHKTNRNSCKNRHRLLFFDPTLHRPDVLW